MYKICRSRMTFHKIQDIVPLDQETLIYKYNVKKEIYQINLKKA